MTAAGSDRYTYGISYVGERRFGDPIDAHIANVRALLCANTIPVIIEIAKYKGQYHISYCTHFEDDRYLLSVQEMFISAGIPCSLEQKKTYVETLAVF